MLRNARASVGGVLSPVINRGIGRATVLRKDEDDQAFEGLIGRACDRLPMRAPAHCLMPNIFHPVFWPGEEGDQRYEYTHGPVIAPDGEAPKREDYAEVALTRRRRDAMVRIHPGVPDDAIGEEIAR